jgi:phosphopantetheinyl transferase (holo-ACP synthase)
VRRSRWAAKEAIIKAASSSFHHPPDGSGKLGFHDIKIWRGPDSHGELSAAVISRQRKDVALNTEVSDEPLAGRIELFTQSDGSDEELDGDMVSLSISHENDYAVATALFC